MNTETEIDKQPSIGQMLRQAREARSLTVPQVAAQLNLAVPLIEKLEQDQFNGDMQETYVRGYIRAYAKLLKIPEKQLVSVFSRETGRQAYVAKPMQTFSNRTKHQTTDNRFLWLTYGIIALFIVLLFVWWWQTEAEFKQSATEVTTKSTAVASSSPDVTLSLSGANSVELTDTTQASTEPANTELTGITQTDTDQTGIEQLSTKQVDSQHQLLPTTPMSADAQAVSTIEQMLVTMQTKTMQAETMQLETASNLEPSAAIVGLDSLQLRFHDACWVNIIDAAGERIAFGTKEKGYVMDLKGQAPFVVTLCNPTVVAISFNHQPYDLSTLPTGRVAKFTIPGSE
ncbi:RodZ domain-containing protein [Rheinheimera salexigens]|uniref:Cytoskeleton protein RodZ-like C-terminal domain-containing protein n=1 Tax=Rheinheimera salexigens TaxID=1628148 RepID=A0A1E7Q3Z7_9GAMM|nr:RodZ domain-containing protein [Rheinheimera salexigens]OEY68851.1 hypothetical protein BI198_04190 [Rheinheimera salexigens]